MTDRDGEGCPACGEPPGHGPLVEVPDREYGLAAIASYRCCGSCGSLFQVPMPTGEELASLYPPGYHSMTGHGSLANVRHDLRLRRLDWVADEGALLDFGCGNGDFLRRVAARHRTASLFGYEIAAETTVTRLEGGVTIVRGHLDALLEVLPEVRVITMNHVIEHLPDPCSTLTSMRQALAVGGRLLGQTPAAGSLEHRLFRTRWSGYHAPRHTVVFSPGGLGALLRRSGFAEARVRPGFNPAGLAVSIASLPQGGTGGFVRRTGAWWFASLGIASVLSPVDRLGGPGIVEFSAWRSAT